MNSFRQVSFAFVAMLAATPLAAQRMGDPTNKVAGSGKLPAGWMARFDPPRAGRPVGTMADVMFEKTASGIHIKSGPAALYYNTSDVASGQYGVSAKFSNTTSMQHEVYGLFIGGVRLQDSTQSYIYFVLRPMDGQFMVSHRTGDAKPETLVPYATNAAVKKEDANGAASNTLLIHVAKDSMHFVINGTVVAALAKSAVNHSTDGIAGVRVNHNMDVQIDGFAIKKQ